MGELVDSAIIFFNVAKSCLGAGIYSYPQMFKLYGSSLVLGMTIISGIASVIGAFAYINLNRKFHKGNSISTLASPSFKYIVDIVVIVKCLAVAAGYMNLSKSIIVEIPFKIGIRIIDENPDIRGHVIVFSCCALLIPSILQPSLFKLKNFSYLGISSIFILIIISLIQTKDKVAKHTEVAFNSKILKDIGTFVFGFTCHQSILNIHNEARITDLRLKIIIAVAFTLVGILYYTFGFINFRAFSDEGSLKEIFPIWNKNYAYLAYFGALVFSMSLIISVPFQIHPAKTYLSDMFSFKYTARLTSVILMMALCYAVSSAPRYDILLVSRVVTKPMNTFLCFGFPLLFTLLNKGKKSLVDWFNCLFLAIFTIICIVSFFYRGVENDTPPSPFFKV